MSYKMSYKLIYCAVLLCGLIAIRQHMFDCRTARFNDYLKKFNKSYGSEEFQRRMLYFEESIEEIRKLNNEHKTGAVHGHTKFSDWSKEEYANLMLKNYHLSSCKGMEMNCIGPRGHRTYNNTPDRFDWREHDDVIGPVGTQKQCNGCWAFSIADVMASMSVINNLGNEQLSVQELIDCTPDTGHCRGGNIGAALKFLCRGFKLASEDRYPLLLVDEECKQNIPGLRGVKNFTVQCDVRDEDIMRNLIHGPVIAVINAKNIKSYTGGIIQWNCHEPSDMYDVVHVIQIVGYDTSDEDEAIDYFIIKNSYGSDWGEDGFFRLARGKNLCGINQHIAYLEVY